MHDLTFELAIIELLSYLPPTSSDTNHPFIDSAVPQYSGL